MLRFVTRKMMNNKWMIICLLIGSILAVGLIGSIPMYAEGVMLKMMYADLQSYQQTTGENENVAVYAGKYLVSAKYSNSSALSARAQYAEMNKLLNEEYIGGLGLSVLSSTVHGNVSVRLMPAGETLTSGSNYCLLNAYKGYEDNITLLYGKMPSHTIKDDTIEVLASRGAEKTLKLICGDEYTVDSEGFKGLRVKVVGIFEYKDNQNAFWYEDLNELNKSFLMDYDLFYNKVINSDENLVDKLEWHFALDYTDINLGNINHVLNGFNNQLSSFGKISNLKADIPAAGLLGAYLARESELNILLLVLQTPILIMLAFYIFMVSQLIIEFDKNEISVLKSRGARRSQIFRVYILQGGLVSLIALLIGPLLAQLACMLIGASSGFLQFTVGELLPVSLRLKVILYCVGAALFSVITMLLPVIRASKTDIVILKRKKARNKNKPLWRRLYLDFVLIGVSIYGIYVFSNRQNSVMAGAGTMPIEPLLYLVSTLFTLGIAMLILRIYPFVINRIFNIGKKRWSPVAYSTLAQVGRQKGKEQFLVVFLIFTITFGIFSANAARTIDRTMVNEINYYSGAEYSVRAIWLDGTGGITRGEPANDSKQVYTPLNFQKYADIDGLSNANKVFRRYQINILAGTAFFESNFMAIEPLKFAESVNMPAEAEPMLTLKDYAELLAQKEDGVLISQSIANQYGLKVGDRLNYTWGTLGRIYVEVVGIFPYWPQYDPLDAKADKLIVVNYDYLAGSDHFQLMPYEIWYTRDEAVPEAEIEQQFTDKKLLVEWSSSVDKQINARRDDAKFKGTNGALNLGFIVTMTISVFGFIIYWILSIKSRALQFGVLRAMGLTVRKVIRMLIGEQGLLSGTAIVSGLLLGTGVSELFVPLLQLAYSNPIPPQSVLMAGGDYIKVLICIGVMLIIGLITIGGLISKINVTAAIKLGED